MTDKLSEEELKAWLDLVFGKSYDEKILSGDAWEDVEQSERAYEQIVALIKKSEVDKAWIEEKTTEIYNLSYYKSFSREQIADCVRKLIEEIQRVA